MSTKVELLQKANFIPPILLRERLDEIQEAVGLVPKWAVFNKKVIVARTKSLYTQTKYNLLREESEGFSKLINELFAILPPSWSDIYQSDRRLTRDTAAQIRQTKVRERVDITHRILKSLIGQFNLDPNRVLDIILDIFMATVVDQYDFFIHLLKSSTWSQDVCSHILGFKFDQYNTPDAPTPALQLFQVAAILIREEVVALDVLYPHLSPADWREERNVEFDKEKPVGEGNLEFVRVWNGLEEEYKEYLERLRRKMNARRLFDDEQVWWCHA